MSGCQYDATGGYTCTQVFESFHSRSDDPNSPSNPDNYPACINTGCSAGRPCTSASGCLNGLACQGGKCVIPVGTVRVLEPRQEVHRDEERREERREEHREEHREERREEHREECREEEESRPWWTWWMWWK